MRRPRGRAETLQHFEQKIGIHAFRINRHADGDCPAFAQHIKNERVCGRFDNHDIAMAHKCGDGKRKPIPRAGHHGHRLRIIRPIAAQFLLQHRQNCRPGVRVHECPPVAEPGQIWADWRQKRIVRSSAGQVDDRGVDGGEASHLTGCTPVESGRAGARCARSGHAGISPGFSTIIRPGITSVCMPLAHSVVHSVSMPGRPSGITLSVESSIFAVMLPGFFLIARHLKDLARIRHVEHGSGTRHRRHGRTRSPAIRAPRE